MSITINPSNIQNLSKASGLKSSKFLKSIKTSTTSSASTYNGAKSYSIGDHEAIVVLFTKSVRGMEMKDPNNPEDTEKYLEFLLDACREGSVQDVVRMIFHIRDCRGGKGERKLFVGGMRWLIDRNPTIAAEVMEHIPYYGSWKDIWRVFLGTRLENQAINFYADAIRKNHAILNSDKEEGKTSFDMGVGKYAPTEGTSFDKKFNLVEKLCENLGITKRHYRKKIIRPLRTARVPFVEELMCSGKWEEIDYEKVPSVASHTYRKAFAKRDKDRYQKYLTSVIKGEKKINAGVIDPCTLLGSYIGSGLRVAKIDETIEAQWMTITNSLMEKRNSSSETLNIVPVCDVSGSMFSGASSVRPICVSVAMSILLAVTNSPPFERMWFNFSDNPSIQKLKGANLMEMINNMDKDNWGMSTNLISVFDMILNMGLMYQTSPENMPQCLVIISDMQFNAANNKVGKEKTNWETINRKYEKAGYKRPTIIFWNVNSASVDMPIPDSFVPDCFLVSGFNTSIFNVILDAKIPKPMDVVRQVLDSERYSRIMVDDELV